MINGVYDSNTLSSLSNLSQILVTFSLCRLVYIPHRHCAELGSRGKLLLCCQMIHMDEPQKAEQSDLIGIQEDTVLPVSKTVPVWEDHCASRENLNAITADE